MKYENLYKKEYTYLTISYLADELGITVPKTIAILKLIGIQDENVLKSKRNEEFGNKYCRKTKGPYGFFYNWKLEPVLIRLWQYLEEEPTPQALEEYYNKHYNRVIKNKRRIKKKKEVIVMKNYIVALKEEVNFVIGTEGCKKCSQLLDFLNEVKAPYIYKNFKNLPKELKLLIWEAKKKTGLKEVSFPMLINIDEICFIDEFDIEEIKKNWYANN